MPSPVPSASSAVDLAIVLQRAEPDPGLARGALAVRNALVDLAPRTGGDRRTERKLVPEHLARFDHVEVFRQRYRLRKHLGDDVHIAGRVHARGYIGDGRPGTGCHLKALLFQRVREYISVIGDPDHYWTCTFPGGPNPSVYQYSEEAVRQVAASGPRHRFAQRCGESAEILDGLPLR